MNAALDKVEEAANEVAIARALYEQGREDKVNVDAREMEYEAACEALIAAMAQGMNGSEPEYTTQVSPAWVGNLAHCWSDGRMTTDGDLGQA